MVANIFQDDLFSDGFSRIRAMISGGRRGVEAAAGLVEEMEAGLVGSLGAAAGSTTGLVEFFLRLNGFGS